MPSNDPAMFRFDLGENGGVLTFSSNEELGSFLSTQISAYEWLRDFSGDPKYAEIANYITNSLIHTHSIAYNGANQYNYPQNIIDQMHVLYSTAGLPIHGSAAYEFIEELRASDGPEVAIGAVAYFANQTKAGFGRLFFKGLTHAASRDIGINKQAAKASRRSLDSLHAHTVNNIHALEQTAGLQNELFERMLSKKQKRSEISRKWIERRFRRLKNRHNSENNIAIHDFQQMQKTYEEFMALKAPVDYWTEKSKKHRQESDRYRNLLLKHGWKVGAAVLVALLIVAALSFTFSQADKPASAYLILVTIGVVITTMAFWVARIIVRLYMSEHHLAIDADERATMVMTYLALTEIRAADEKERALILAPLFRPSSDGIVKDDAAPDLSPAALLSKMLSK